MTNFGNESIVSIIDTKNNTIIGNPLSVGVAYRSSKTS